MKNDINNNEFQESVSQEDVSIKDMLVIAFQYRIWFILSLIVMVALGVLYVKTKPNIYARSATIIVEDERRGGSTSEAAVFQELFSMGGGSVYNEIGLFESNRLMYDVIERLGMDVRYITRDKLRSVDLYKTSPINVTFSDLIVTQDLSFIVELLSEGQARVSELTFYNAHGLGNHVELEAMVVNLGAPIITEYGEFTIKPTLFMTEQSVGKQITVRRTSIKNAAHAYKKRLKVTLVDKYASLVVVSTTDQSIQRAEDIINTLIEVYRDDAINDKNIILTNTTKFIEDRLSIIEADLTQVDEQIEKFKRENNITDITSQGAMYMESVTRIDQESINILNQLSMAKYMKSYLEDNANVEALLPVNLGIADAGLQSQIALYNESMTRRQKLLVNSSENNPMVIDLQTMLVSMRSSILLSVNNLIANLEIQSANFTKKESESLGRIKDMSTQQKYIISIMRQQTIKEQLYLYLLNKKEESELQRSITESNCRIVDYAEGNTIPIAPQKKLIIFFCMIIGLLIPAAVLYIISLFNTTVMSGKDISGAVSIPYLGEIPTEKVVPENRVVVADGSRNAVGEAFRIVRDNIDFMGSDDSSRGTVLQMTSLNPNSGKTFIAVNIAMSMALAGSKVILVDLDIRKGTLSTIAGIGIKQSGISQYLSGKIDSLSDIIRPFAANCPFDIISSGVLPPNPSELLKRPKLAEMLDELRDSYDYILVDNPPYGVVVDTAICSRLCDRSIYVIRAGSFDKRFLANVQDLYDTQKLKNMTLLLNGVDAKLNNYGYGYGYGYNYGDNKKSTWIKRVLGI
ncbi:MAG: polysaccharide biosynthesis tyrosine autokinase [Rikenellaceae bacterium]